MSGDGEETDVVPMLYMLIHVHTGYVLPKCTLRTLTPSIKSTLLLQPAVLCTVVSTVDRERERPESLEFAIFLSFIRFNFNFINIP